MVSASATSGKIKPLTEKEQASTIVTVLPGELVVSLNKEETKVFAGWDDGNLISVTFNYKEKA